jgi:hypothetical protein
MKKLLIRLSTDLHRHLCSYERSRYRDITIGEEYYDKNLNQKYLELLEQRDTSDVWRQFAIWILVDPKHGVRRFTNPGSYQYNVITKVAQLYIDDCKDAQVWEEAATATFRVAKASCDNSYFAAKAAACAAKVVYCILTTNHFVAADDIDVIGVFINAYQHPEPAMTYYHTEVAYNAAADAREVLAFRAAIPLADKLIELINSAPPKETI